MTKARKVVMAALAGSMLMGSMPVMMAVDSGTMQATGGLLCLGIGGGAAITGFGIPNEKILLAVQILGVVTSFAGGMLYRKGIAENIEKESDRKTEKLMRQLQQMRGESLKNAQRR